MNTTEAHRPRRHGWIAGLAVASLVLPVAAVLPGGQGGAAVLNPTNQSDYRMTVAALAIAIGCAVITFVFNQAIVPAWLRWLSIGLSSLGVLIAVYLLVALIGTCGLQVLWGACAP